MYKDYLNSQNFSLFTTGSRFSLASIFIREGFKDSQATFDLFIRELPNSRNYFVFAGLEQAVLYLKNLKFNRKQLAWLSKKFRLNEAEKKYYRNFRFSGDAWAMPEGTIFFPNEPIIRITAPIIEAQLIEQFLINSIYLQTSLASKLARFVIAANGKVTGIGFNRSYGIDAAMKSSRVGNIFKMNTGLSAYNYQHNSQTYTTGTFHFLIMAFDSELEAFRAYLRQAKGRGHILIDTYDYKRGIKNFIRVAKELKKEGIGPGDIIIDSGNLYQASLMAKKALTRAGFGHITINAMSNLDEYRVADLEKKQAPIDGYMGTTELLTPSDAPTLELVYKLSEVQKGELLLPKMKTSSKKMSLPGKKQVLRIEKNNKYLGDTIIIDRGEHQKNKLLIPIIKNGKIVYKFPSLNQINQHFLKEKEKFPPQLFNIYKKFIYPITVSRKLKILAEKTRREIKYHHKEETEF